MRNRLRPFVPDRSLRLVVWRAQDVGVDVDPAPAELTWRQEIQLLHVHHHDGSNGM